MNINLEQFLKVEYRYWKNKNFEQWWNRNNELCKRFWLFMNERFWNILNNC